MKSSKESVIMTTLASEVADEWFMMDCRSRASRNNDTDKCELCRLRFICYTASKNVAEHVITSGTYVPITFDNYRL